MEMGEERCIHASEGSDHVCLAVCRYICVVRACECAFEVVYACIWSSDPVTIPSSSQHHSWSSIKVQWRGEIATLTDKGVGVGGCVTWVGGGGG